MTGSYVHYGSSLIFRTADRSLLTNLKGPGVNFAGSTIGSSGGLADSEVGRDELPSLPKSSSVSSNIVGGVRNSYLRAKDGAKTGCLCRRSQITSS